VAKFVALLYVGIFAAQYVLGMIIDHFYQCHNDANGVFYCQGPQFISKLASFLFNLEVVLIFPGLILTLIIIGGLIIYDATKVKR